MKYEMTIKEACNSGFWSCLEPTDWIALISVVIAMIAAVASWMAIYSQKRINEKNQEAIIVPGIKSVEAKIEHILSDWDVEGEIPKKFSNTKLPIWNYGNSPVFNVRYCYYIENIDGLIQEEENEMGEHDDHAINVIKDKDSYELYVSYKNIENRRGSHRREIRPYIRHVDVINPKENTKILIPDYFIIMLNDYFINSLFYDKKPPILLLKISYDDIDFNTWELKFRIFIPSSYQFTNEEALTTSLHYEVVQTKQKKKRLTVEENERLMKKRKEKEAKQ
ncbi:hypothetical protein [Bacillus tropicus]|uniref:hypothetical protein n=1 Tax=Bacillus tropicus TaxID=2026188 RepID=UPI003D1E5586